MPPLCAARSPSPCSSSPSLGSPRAAATGSSGPTTVPPPADVVITAVEGIRWDKPDVHGDVDDGKVVIQGRNDSSLGHNLYVVAADGKQVAEHEDLGKKGDSRSPRRSTSPRARTR